MGGFRSNGINASGMGYMASRAMGLMNANIGNSFDKMGELATNIDDQRKKKEVLQVLGIAPASANTEPLQGPAMDGNGVAMRELYRAEDQTPLDYQQQQSQALMNIDGMDATTALGLAEKSSQPYYGQQERSTAADTLAFDQGIDNAKLVQKADELQSIDSYRDKTAGDFGMFTDDYGKSWKIDKNSGDLTEVNTGIGSGNMTFGGAGGKNIVMVDKTVPDGHGGSTTVKVPVDKRTGQTVKGEVPTVVKQAVLSQKDRDFTKNYGQGSTTLNNVRGTLNNTGIWGGLDAITGKVGEFFGTEEGGKQSLLKQDLENLRLEATNKLSGVLSNQDMQIILDTIPTVSDQPDIARQKLAKVEASIAKADANQFNRLIKSNPNAVKDMAIGMVNGTTPVPTGYQLVQYDDGSVSLIPK